MRVIEVRASVYPQTHATQGERKLPLKRHWIQKLLNCLDAELHLNVHIYCTDTYECVHEACTWCVHVHMHTHASAVIFMLL